MFHFLPRAAEKKEPGTAMKGINISLVLFFSPHNLDGLCQLSGDKMSLKVVFLTEKPLNRVRNNKQKVQLSILLMVHCGDLTILHLLSGSGLTRISAL